MADDKNLQDITKRLDAIIKFLLDDITRDTSERKQKTLVDLVKELKQLGFDNSDIAPLVGRSKRQVAKLAYESKRKKKNKHRKTNKNV